ncbi:ABC transporter permease [Glaciecola sp. MH2013]|uniref:ABC transporter permease n=1 Tax=Glaciecola sp. MH2013 TaxID=2785524 RepID=UPI0018A0E629|nr:ABC transporter permease [Glaciecola sp. MH2013]MBF7073478.1 ABC transporter permease [Glaciecola sp. MH2013]
MKNKTSKTVFKRERSFTGECWALSQMSLSNIWQSKWSSLSIIGCIFLMVAVQTTFLSMSEGFQSSLNSAGSDNIAVIFDKQSKSESRSRISREQVELLRNHSVIREAKALFSEEFRMTVSVLSNEQGKKMNVALRGIKKDGIALRDGFAITQGRRAEAGRFEIIIGASLAARIQGAELGNDINLGGKNWTIVGFFTLNNEVFETEIWGELGMVQAGYERENQYQSIRIGYIQTPVIQQLKALTQEDPRLTLDVSTERQIYSDQIKDTSNVILYLGWPLAIILGLGALVGILNIMFISLEARLNSFKIVGLLGYSTPAIAFSIIFETILLALIGGVVGIAFIALLIDGSAAWAVTGGLDTEIYNINVGPSTIAQTIGFASLLGLLGGALPAFKSLHWESTKPC